MSRKAAPKIAFTKPPTSFSDQVRFDSVDSPEIRELPQYFSVGEMSLIDNANALLRLLAQEQPICLLLIDVDHFKSLDE
ncbi:hypothetical protein D5085_17395 [Ectothiorhodospiraceae bacterium BW-2]|nr:hypothetical protein D5085_17395 [Ectothiorhodospiraceae bacterium BW-2]